MMAPFQSFFKKKIPGNVLEMQVTYRPEKKGKCANKVKYNVFME